MSNTGENNQNRNQIKFIGKPNKQNTPEELTRWQRFLKRLLPVSKEGARLFGKGKKLTEEYYDAEVSKKKAETVKLAEESANIAVQKDLAKQQKVKVVNDEIQRIFSDNNTPMFAKHLQLANLLSANPEIEEQLEKINAIMQRLKIVNFAEIDISVDEGDSSSNVQPVEEEPQNRNVDD